MSAFDDFIKVRDQLVGTFGVPMATITAITRSASASDRARGRVNTTTTSTRTVPALLGKRTVKTEDGTIVTQTVATCFAEVIEGERLTLGANTYVIGAVEPTNPTGVHGYKWTAILS